MDPEALANLSLTDHTADSRLYPKVNFGVAPDSNGYTSLGMQLRTDTGNDDEDLQEDWCFEFDSKTRTCKGRRVYSNTSDCDREELMDEDVLSSPEFLEWENHCARKPINHIVVGGYTISIVTKETNELAQSLGTVMGKSFARRYGKNTEAQTEQNLQMQTNGGQMQN